MPNNEFTNPVDTSQSAIDVQQAAKQLAALLKQSKEFQEFVSLGNSVNLDAEIGQLIQEIRYYQYHYNENNNRAKVEKLLARLESNPLYKAYQEAEEAVCYIFQSTNDAISAIAGINYAQLARREGCGCGCGCS